MYFEVIPFELFRFIYIFAPYFDPSLSHVKTRTVDQSLLRRHILTNETFSKFLYKIDFVEFSKKILSKSRITPINESKNVECGGWTVVD